MVLEELRIWHYNNRGNELIFQGTIISDRTGRFDINALDNPMGEYDEIIREVHNTLLGTIPNEIMEDDMNLG